MLSFILTHNDFRKTIDLSVYLVVSMNSYSLSISYSRCVHKILLKYLRMLFFLFNTKWLKYWASERTNENPILCTLKCCRRDMLGLQPYTLWKLWKYLNDAAYKMPTHSTRENELDVCIHKTDEYGIRFTHILNRKKPERVKTNLHAKKSNHVQYRNVLQKEFYGTNLFLTLLPLKHEIDANIQVWK